MKRKGLITIDAAAIPIVELDSSAHAAYVRFSNNKVARTDEVTSCDCIVTMDFDESGKVVGVELVGVTDFRVESLLNKAGIRNVSPAMSQNARYVPANLQVA